MPRPRQVGKKPGTLAASPVRDGGQPARARLYAIRPDHAGPAPPGRRRDPRAGATRCGEWYNTDSKGEQTCTLQARDNILRC